MSCGELAVGYVLQDSGAAESHGARYLKDTVCLAILRAYSSKDTYRRRALIQM